MKLSDVNISGKLYSLILIAFAGIAFMGVMDYRQIEQVYSSASYSAVNSLPSVVVLDELRHNYLLARISLARHILAKTPEEKNDFEASLALHRRGVDAALKKYKDEGLISDRHDLKLMTITTDLWRHYDVYIDRILAASRAGQVERAKAALTAATPLSEELSTQINGMVAHNLELGNLANEKAAATKANVLSWATVIALTELAALSLAAWLIATRGMMRPIGAVVEDLTRLASGQLDIVLRGLHRRDELGNIARAAQVFKEFAQKLHGQGWMKSKASEISSAVQSAETLEDFAAKVLELLAPAMECGAAVFYVLQSESETLDLMGGWGYQPRDNLRTSYRLGEGLVGQCARSRSALLIDNVPKDYIRISSSLGEAPPRVVLVAPMLAKGTATGVIELASFKPFTDEQRALMDELLPVLALNLEILKRNMKTRLLLQETQEQAQRLQASEEELRMQGNELAASNEELRAQTDALKAVNEELTVKSNALELAQAESERRAAELEAASRYKSDFLANMSHELRTPLNSLLILAGNLLENQEANLTKDQIESVQIIQDGGHQLLNLINDILDLAKVEAGKMTLVESELELPSFAATLRRNFAAVAAKQGLAWAVEVAPDLPATLWVDAGKMEQILTNLIGNAFKFTQRGGVKVRLSTTLSADKLVVAVEDSGIGIPASKQEKIFAAFEQVDATSSRQYGGTGLGLTISRRLADVLGGSVTVQSLEGQGSTFTLTLPLRRSSQTAASPAFADDRASLHPGESFILVVEDDDVFAQLECDLVRRRGYKCLHAVDGKSALQLAEHYRPIGILLDIGLPDLDGWTVMSMLKQNPVTRDIPVRVISGREVDEQGAPSGTIEYLRKPATKEQLNAVLDKFGANAESPIRRLLVVDDDIASRKAIASTIKNDATELFEARDGYTALEMLSAGHFDCVVLDLELPDFGGFELLQRATEQGLTLPSVIVYTNKNLSYEENLALREYTDSIIVKGERSPERLADEVSLFLNSVNTEHTPHRATPTNGTSGVAHELKGRTVLVVDDDMRNAFALSKVLRGKGMSVLLAQDGYKALAQLEANADVDLVLMDMMMPGMDGLETIREIRKQPRFKDLPIVALTAKAMPGDRENCLEVGADDYLSKPVDIEKLMAAMLNLLLRQG